MSAHVSPVVDSPDTWRGDRGAVVERTVIVHANDSALPNDSALVGLALQVARTPAANLDVGAMLAGVCSALPVAAGIAGAVLVMVEAPDPMTGVVFASDAAAARLGEAAQRAGAGPLADAMFSGRVSATSDLTRIPPSELAAVAAETGLASAVTIPFALGGRPAGALQLLGTGYRPVPVELAEVVRPLLDVVVALLSDSRAFGRLYAAVADATSRLETGVPVAQAAGVLAERYRTDVEEAARFLVAQAAQSGTALADAAASVVAGAGSRDIDDPARRLPGPRGTEPVGSWSSEVDPLGWLEGDLPMPRASRRRHRAVEGGADAPVAEGVDAPTAPHRPARHRRADIS